MASIQINRGNSQEINNTPITDGLILFNTTNKTIYMDNENTRDVYSGQLSNSSDVEIVNLSDGQIIIWDATNNKWKNTDRYFEINNLTDVNLNSLVNGQILKYDETSDKWINTNYAINDLSNVNINLSTLADGQIVVYNATTDKWENSEVKGGHKILNDGGTTLAQKDYLQFKGVYTHNVGDNSEVDICRTMTKAQMEALSGEELKGFINTSDEPDSLPLTAEWVGYENGTVKDALDNKVSKTGDTMTGKLTINRTNTGTSNVSSVLELGNNIPDGTTGTSKGVLNLYGTSANMAQIMAGNLTDRREITIPNKSGTMALTSDLTADNVSYSSGVSVKDILAKKSNSVTPSSSGKSTLLAYILDVLYPQNYSIYSFVASGFSDLPSTNWGYTITVHFEAGAIYVECYRHLSNAQVFYRGISSQNQWVSDWVATGNASLFTTTSFTNSKCNSAYEIRCIRNGNVIAINTVINNTTEDIGSNEVLATIPEAFRPSNNYAYCVSTNNIILQVTDDKLHTANISGTIPHGWYYPVNMVYVRED